MYHRERRKMKVLILLSIATVAIAKSDETDKKIIKNDIDDSFDNNIIDFDEDYSVKFNKNYGGVSWNDAGFKKESHRYTVINGDISTNEKETRFKNKINRTKVIDKQNVTQDKTEETTTSVNDYSSIPAELLSTTIDPLVSIIESTIEPDLSVIPLTTNKLSYPELVINQTVTLPPSTQIPDTTPDLFSMTTEDNIQSTTVSEIIDSATTKRQEKEKTNETLVTIMTTTVSLPSTVETTERPEEEKVENVTPGSSINQMVDSNVLNKSIESPTMQTNSSNIDNSGKNEVKADKSNLTEPTITEDINYRIDKNSSTEKREYHLPSPTTNQTNNNTNANLTAKITKDKNASIVHLKTSQDRTNQTNQTQSKNKNGTHSKNDSTEDVEVPIFTGLDTEEETEVPEDYYDSKDVLPTPAPKTDALSVIFGLAGSVVESVVESVAERVVPKGIFDLFKRMQKQNEALEAERLRSREENGGLGQFGRGLLKSISSGLSGPLTQLMAARDIGSLDTDRGFVSSVSTSVASAATTLADAFKDRVQAIYPGTVWCGDGHAASARSGELGLFFFTDTCCRQHDACRLYIRAGETKHGLTNTGLFTRSHCSCDLAFRECLHRTNSLVSAQIGLTYFNVLGPQCFRKAHPIVRCVRRTRITGQKCEEYELDYTKPKMWQWFDNETF